MKDIFDPFRSLLHISPLSTDNNIFKLHYKVTMFILIAFSLLLTQKQYLGDPIDCYQGGDGIDEEFMDTFCWIESTYTVAGKRHGKIPAGISTDHDPETGEKNEKIIHSYYQWVTLLLYLQAVMFYIPRYIWKTAEGGKMKMLVSDLHLPIADVEEREGKIKAIVSYFKLNIGEHNMYFIIFIICEVLNFINVISQMFLINWFVGKEFSTYGLNVLSQTDKIFYNRTDPMEFVFPKVTKCNLKTIGPTGGHQLTDAVCVLPGNVFNEKIYLILWFWLGFMAIASAFGLAYRFCTFATAVRNNLLHLRSKISDQKDIAHLVKVLPYGDWFLLNQMAKNLEIFTMRDLIAHLADQV